MITNNIVDRLRGKYVVAVNDGAGTLEGKQTFERTFETPPIQHEAAAEIEKLRELIRHAFIHSAYKDLGFLQMTTPEKQLFTSLLELWDYGSKADELKQFIRTD